MNAAKEKFLREMRNAEFPPARLEELECPVVEARLLHLVRTTNKDGTQKVGEVSSQEAPAPSPPAFIRAIMSDLDPYKNYADAAASTCPYCNLPELQCVEVLFGGQMCHYFMRAAMSTGVINYLEDETDSQVAIRRNFMNLLTQLKFAVAVTNGTRLPAYSDDGSNPFINGAENVVDAALPRCVVNGSCAKFEHWLWEQQMVHEWGYDISPFTEVDDVEYPLCVVNFYREALEDTN